MSKFDYVITKLENQNTKKKFRKKIINRIKISSKKNLSEKINWKIFFSVKQFYQKNLMKKFWKKNLSKKKFLSKKIFIGKKISSKKILSEKFYRKKIQKIQKKL